MKKRLCLFLSFTIPLLCFSQQDIPTLVNKGILFVDGQNTENSSVNLYIKGAFQAEGSSLFKNTGKTVLTGDFINNVTSGNVFAPESPGVFEFRCENAQYIKGTALKSLNYIDFPDITVLNHSNETTDPDAHLLVIDANTGVSVKNLYLNKGRLILDSKIDPQDNRASINAHLFVKTGGDIRYNYTPDEAYNKGTIQVNLAVGDNYMEKRLIGFAPPFKKIYADYFFYNFLSSPSNKGLFGDQGKLITNPTTVLTAGKGYIVGQGIVDDLSYYENIEKEWPGALYEKRATEVFSFNRIFAEASFSQHITNSTKFTDEEINTGNEKIIVDIEQGFNYLGNPFTVPLDMTSFCRDTGVSDDWEITRGAGGNEEVKNSFYVMSNGTGTHRPNDIYSPFRFTVNYLLGQYTGSTIDPEGNEALRIAPMQMFIVDKNTSGNSKIVIPASARSHGKTKFLRNNDPSNNLVDEILIETQDTETGGYDRMCVVFRDDASLNATDLYDANKFFNKSGGVNQLYTKSIDNKDLTTNIIPPTTEKLQMYFEPSAQEQQVLLKAYRTHSIRSFSSIILEDTKTGNRQDLLSEKQYVFTSSPNDKYDRFILHFLSGSTDIKDEISNSSVNIAYNDGLIKLYGLKNTDIGSNILIINTQGQLIHQQEIKDYPEYSFLQNLNSGVYIIKMAGKKTLINKLLIK